MTDTARAKLTVGFLEAHPTTIVLDGKKIPSDEVLAIYQLGRRMGDEGDAGRADAMGRLAAPLGLDPEVVGDKELDDFLRFVDEKWAHSPPASIPPGKKRVVELDGFVSEDNPLGIHPDCAEIFTVERDDADAAEQGSPAASEGDEEPES